MRTFLIVISSLILLFAAGVAAQTVDPSTTDPLTALTDLLALTSVTGIVTGSVFLVWIAKKKLALVPVLSSIPIWCYTVAIALGLTYLANQVLHSLAGDFVTNAKQAVLLAAAASGVREWFASGITTPLAESGVSQSVIRETGSGTVSPRL
jgi:hypothetical protein